MHLLYFTQSHPLHTQDGGSYRNHGIVSGLVERSELHVVYLEPRRVPAQVLVHAPFKTPVDLHTIPTHAEARAAAQALIHTLKPDVLWHNWKFPWLRVGSFPRIPTIIDLCDPLWYHARLNASRRQGIRKVRTHLNALRYRRQDNAAAQAADVVLLAALSEKNRLKTHRPVMELPNGYDFAVECPPRLHTGPRLLFVGDIHAPANLDGLAWFIRDVWQHVRKQIPDAQLDIIGSGGETFADTENVSAHGFVPDLTPWQYNAAALIVPLHVGTGSRIKILEAWANGLPVISTRIGAKNLMPREGENLLLADDAKTFADACVRLLNDRALGAQLAANAFAHGKAHFDWQAIYPRLDEILETAQRSHVQRNA